MEYRVLAELGSGSTGTVFLVEDQDGLLYAIKEIEIYELPSHERNSVLKEIRATKHLKHDNILKYYDATMADELIHVRMEYAENGTLDDLISERRRFLPEETIIDLFTQVCLAVKYLHDRKILHRNIKPTNIFIAENNIVKLGDFGLAHFLPSTDDKVNTAKGTVNYRSPEMCNGQPYGAPADVWALGCVLYELCTRRLAFTGRSVLSVMRKITTKEPKRIPSIYSDELRQLARDMLQKDPAKRPTINYVLDRSIIKCKAMALLPSAIARAELDHDVFHGTPAGETPEELKSMLENVRLDVIETGQFVFMGRPINVDGATHSETRDNVHKFLLELVPEKEIQELRKRVRKCQYDDLTALQSAVVIVVAQMIAFEQANDIT